MFDNVWNFVKNYYFYRLIPTYSSVGQNLYIGFSTKKTEDCPVEKAVMAWYNEVLKFSVANLDPFIFVEATGHYTQLAWGDTYKVPIILNLSLTNVKMFPTLNLYFMFTLFILFLPEFVSKVKFFWNVIYTSKRSILFCFKNNLMFS